MREGMKFPIAATDALVAALRDHAEELTGSLEGEPENEHLRELANAFEGYQAVLNRAPGRHPVNIRDLWAVGDELHKLAVLCAATCCNGAGADIFSAIRAYETADDEARP
jgi:hypothetical protein